MAAAGIRPGTEGILGLADEWATEFMARPNEESVIANEVTVAGESRTTGEVMHISIIPAATIRELGPTGQADSTALTFETATVQEVQVTPLATYIILDLPRHLISRLSNERESSLRATYRKQMSEKFGEKTDIEIGELATGISNALGAPSPIDSTLLLAGQSLLSTNAKNKVGLDKDGMPKPVLVYHPSQIQYVNQSVPMAHAYARGDNKGTKGIVIDVYNCRLKETGNVYCAAGVCYNMLFTKEAFVVGYNEKPNFLPPQMDGLVERLPAYQDVGVAELFDECAVVLRSAA